MKLEPRFLLRPLPGIPDSTQPKAAVAPGESDPSLGFLSDLPGTWKGTGFNVIWRPNSKPGQDRFLELNLTAEVLGKSPTEVYCRGISLCTALPTCRKSVMPI
jgi:hypothetical protein